MAVLLPSPFCRYEMTEPELLQGSALTTLQAQCIQNLIADAAASRLAMDLDPKNPESFAQQEAFLKGQIAAFQHLLNTSEAAILQLNTHN